MTYEQKLDELIEKYAEPFKTSGYITSDEFDVLKSKLRKYFLENRPELLDIRVVGKIQDLFAECAIQPGYSETSLNIVETDGKFTVKVTIDPDDPDPAQTLEFIALELNKIHPDLEIEVVE